MSNESQEHEDAMRLWLEKALSAVDVKPIDGPMDLLSAIVTDAGVDLASVDPAAGVNHVAALIGRNPSELIQTLNSMTEYMEVSGKSGTEEEIVIVGEPGNIPPHPKPVKVSGLEATRSFGEAGAVGFDGFDFDEAARGARVRADDKVVQGALDGDARLVEDARRILQDRYKPMFDAGVVEDIPLDHMVLLFPEQYGLVPAVEPMTPAVDNSATLVMTSAQVSNAAEEAAAVTIQTAILDSPEAMKVTSPTSAVPKFEKNVAEIEATFGNESNDKAGYETNSDQYKTDKMQTDLYKNGHANRITNDRLKRDSSNTREL